MRCGAPMLRATLILQPRCHGRHGRHCATAPLRHCPLTPTLARPIWGKGQPVGYRPTAHPSSTILLKATVLPPPKGQLVVVVVALSLSPSLIVSDPFALTYHRGYPLHCPFLIVRLPLGPKSCLLKQSNPLTFAAYLALDVRCFRDYTRRCAAARCDRRCVRW